MFLEYVSVATENIGYEICRFDFTKTVTVNLKVHIKMQIKHK